MYNNTPSPQNMALLTVYHRINTLYILSFHSQRQFAAHEARDRADAQLATHHGFSAGRAVLRLLHGHEQLVRIHRVLAICSNKFLKIKDNDRLENEI